MLSESTGWARSVVGRSLVLEKVCGWCRSALVGGVKSSWEGGELAIGLGDGTILQVALFLRCVSKHTNFLLH